MNRLVLFLIVGLFVAEGSLLAQSKSAPEGGKRKVSPGEVAAVVNSEMILLAEVDALARRQPVGELPYTAEQLREVRRAIVEDMIDDMVLSQFLRDKGPKVEQAEVEKRFQLLKASLEKRGQSIADFARELGKTEAHLKDAWAATIQFEKYVEGQATDAELRRYHAANKLFFDRAAVKVSHIMLRVSPDAPPGEWTTARQKLAQIRREIVSGEIDFAAAAKKYSLDATARRGGEIGYIARRDTIVDEEFAQAAFALPVGEISQPVDTEFGCHLILVSERKTPPGRSYEEVAEEVRDCYAEDLRISLVKKLRKQADIRVTLP